MAAVARQPRTLSHGGLPVGMVLLPSFSWQGPTQAWRCPTGPVLPPLPGVIGMGWVACVERALCETLSTACGQPPGAPSPNHHTQCPGLQPPTSVGSLPLLPLAVLSIASSLPSLPTLILSPPYPGCPPHICLASQCPLWPRKPHGQLAWLWVGRGPGLSPSLAHSSPWGLTRW